MSLRHLPVSPNLDQLKHQAKDLLRQARSGAEAALAEIRQHCGETVNPADARLAQAFQDMRAQADFVVVVAAPVLEISHTIALARASDIVAVVADARHTTREAASAAAQEIRATGPRTIVGVLTGSVDMASASTRRAVTIPARWGARLEAGRDPVPPRVWAQSEFDDGIGRTTVP